MTKDVILRVLDKRKAEIRTRWAEEIVASSPKYADRPMDEVLSSVDQMIAGRAVTVTFGSGDPSPSTRRPEIDRPSTIATERPVVPAGTSSTTAVAKRPGAEIVTV